MSTKIISEPVKRDQLPPAAAKHAREVAESIENPIEAEPSKVKPITVKRDGDRDLTFRGLLVGEGEHGSGGNSGYSGDWNRGTDVKIYRTAGGRYVVAVKQWSRWQGEGSIHRAEVCSSAAEVLAWLTADCGGELGPASKAAWEDAVDRDDGITAIASEEVE